MKSSVIAWLKSPTFDTNEKTLLAFYLNLTLITALFGIIIFMLVFPVIQSFTGRQFVSLLFGFSAVIYLKVMLNRKQLGVVRHIFLLLAWVGIASAPVLDVGVYSPGMTSFVLLILFAGVLARQNMPIYMAIVSMLTAFGIAFLMRLDVIQTVANHPIPIEAATIAYCVIYAIVGAITYASSTIVYHTIDQLRDSQAEANHSTYYLKRAENLAQLGNFEIDLQTEAVKWSDQMYRIFGIEPGIPMSLKTYGSLVTADMLNQVKANLQQAIETNEPYEVEYPIVTSDGIHKEILVLGNPVTDDNGQVVKVFGVVQDITERKQAERIQQLLLNISSTRHTSDNLETLSEKMIAQLGKVINVKNCYIALYDEKTGKYTFPYGTDEYDNDWSPQAMNNSLTDHVRRTGIAQLITEAKHLRMLRETDLDFTGTWSKVWVGAPLRIHQRVIGVIAVQDYHDAKAYKQSDLDLLTYVGDNIGSIIESKQAEREHIALELQMQKNEFLQEFIGHMTHDIKTPLSVIKNSTYLLKNVKDTSRQLEFIDRIDYQLDRLDRIIEDILTISRLEHIDQSSYTTIKLKELIEHITNQLHPKVQRRKIDLQLDLAHNLPVFMGNESDLTRALLNLVENAIHYTEQDGRVMVRAFVDDDDIICQIEDSGIGISPDDLPFIFDRFYRANNARDFERGTGLGLAIVKRVFELHHSIITVSSVVGDGTTFTVRMKITELAQLHKRSQPHPES